jgi:hypothetical protein
MPSSVVSNCYLSGKDGSGCMAIISHHAGGIGYGNIVPTSLKNAIQQGDLLM